VSSLRVRPLFTRQTVLAVFLGIVAMTAQAQYPGQVAKKSKDTVQLRAIAVLEYTGEEGKPKTSRLVPVTVYDGQSLQDANVYLARPQPLALAGEVEYELEKNGKPLGIFDIKNSGQEQGSWVGYGAWKPLPVPKAEPPKPVLDDGFDSSNDRPVLHRKHANGSGSSKDDGKGKDNGSDSSAPSAPSDPDRPTMHKKTPSTDSSSTDAHKGSSVPTPDPAPDPDSPTLHKKTPSDSNDTAAVPDPDRPTMHAKKKVASESKDEENSGFTDPDRPRLKRGKSSGNGLDVLPSLLGLPPDMQQAVAVSDAKSKPEHPWSYTWADPADEGKMKQSLESIARDALGLKTAVAAPVPRRTSAKTKARPTKTLPPAPPPPLLDEQFRVFELAYGSGATMVLSAHTDGPLAQQKFVTLVAQPDLYGNLQVLLKNVTDGVHLDETPRMRLVDAVDALADNRGELLFELRGATQRQFALYRVIRGRAEKLFVTGGGEYGVAGD
jgi:hypothetical protein